MKRFLMLCALGSIALCGSDALSQSRDIGAQRLVLDDGLGGRLYISYAGPGDGTLVIPSGGGSLAPSGTTLNSTLAWNGTAWVENLNLLANPVAGGITVNGGIDNTGDGITNAGAISGATTIDASTGYTVGGAAPAGEFLRGDGTTFVSSPIMASDLPAGSGSYINNSTTPQTADYNITGDGTIGDDLTVTDDLTVGGLIALPATTATDGQITMNGARVLHTYGNSNIHVGLSGNFTQTGSGNVSMGNYSLDALTTGNFNTAIGETTLTNNTTGTLNTAVGVSSMAQNTIGQFNTAIGASSLQNNSTGSSNTAGGNFTLNANTTGQHNTGFGNGALSTNATGSSNTALGSGANVSSSALSNVTVLGAGALATASNQVVLGDINVTQVTTTGTINSGAGYTVAGAAPAGQFLRGNGTRFVAGPITAADLPAGSGSYINNSTTPQTADFNITGTGTIGDGNDNIALNAGSGAFSLTSSGLDINAAGDITDASSLTFLANPVTANRLITANMPSGPGQGTGIEIRGGQANGAAPAGWSILRGGYGTTDGGGTAGVVGGQTTDGFGGIAAMNGGFSSTGQGGWAMVTGGPSNSNTGGHVYIQGGGSNTALGGDVNITAGSGPGGMGSIYIGPVTLQELKVAPGGNKYAGLVTTNNALDNIETIYNSLLTANSMVVVTLNTDLGATYILNAVPGVGMMDVTFSASVPNGSKLTYVIIN